MCLWDLGRVITRVFTHRKRAYGRLVKYDNSQVDRARPGPVWPQLETCPVWEHHLLWFLAAQRALCMQHAAIKRLQRSASRSCSFHRIYNTWNNAATSANGSRSGIAHFFWACNMGTRLRHTFSTSLWQNLHLPYLSSWIPVVSSPSQKVWQQICLPSLILVVSRRRF